MAHFEMFYRSTNFLYSTVRIEVTDSYGRSGSGTAFFFEDYKNPESHPSYLVTNVHVLEDANNVRIKFHCGDKWDNIDRWIELSSPSGLWTSHPNPEVDLCAISVERLRELADGQLDD